MSTFLTTLCNLAQFSRPCYLWVVPHLYRDLIIQEHITQETKRKGRIGTPEPAMGKLTKGGCSSRCVFLDLIQGFRRV